MASASVFESFIPHDGTLPASSSASLLVPGDHALYRGIGSGAMFLDTVTTTTALVLEQPAIGGGRVHTFPGKAASTGTFFGLERRYVDRLLAIDPWTPHDAYDEPQSQLLLRHTQSGRLRNTLRVRTLVGVHTARAKPPSGKEGVLLEPTVRPLLSRFPIPPRAVLGLTLRNVPCLPQFLVQVLVGYRRGRHPHRETEDVAYVACTAASDLVVHLVRHTAAFSGPPLRRNFR